MMAFYTGQVQRQLLVKWGIWMALSRRESERRKRGWMHCSNNNAMRRVSSCLLSTSWARILSFDPEGIRAHQVETGRHTCSICSSSVWAYCSRTASSKNVEFGEASISRFSQLHLCQALLSRRGLTYVGLCFNWAEERDGLLYSSFHHVPYLLFDTVHSHSPPPFPKKNEFQERRASEVAAGKESSWRKNG